MSQIEILIPAQHRELENALNEFFTESFATPLTFTTQKASEVAYKDASVVEVLTQIAIFIATLEGVIQFAERAKRMESVKKLLAAIKQSGKPVIIKIDDQPPVDLSQQSVDETMDLLSKRKKPD